MSDDGAAARSDEAAATKGRVAFTRAAGHPL